MGPSFPEYLVTLYIWNKKKLGVQIKLFMWTVVRRVNKIAKKLLLVSSCPSLTEQLGSHWKDFHEILYFRIFRNLLRNSGFGKMWHELQVLYMKIYVNSWQFLAKFWLEWDMFRTKFVEKIKKTVFITFHVPRKSCPLWDNVVQSDRPQLTVQYGACSLHAGQLRLQTHTHKLIICNLLLFHGKTGYANVP